MWHTKRMQLSVSRSLRIVAVVTVLVLVVLLISLLSTTPDRLGPFGITLWFVGVLIALGGVLTLMLYSIRRNLSARDHDVLFTTSLRQGVLISTWASGLFALSSLHQLDLKDIVLVSLLVVLIEFYLRRVQPS